MENRSRGLRGDAPKRRYMFGAAAPGTETDTGVLERRVQLSNIPSESSGGDGGSQVLTNGEMDFRLIGHLNRDVASDSPASWARFRSLAVPPLSNSTVSMTGDNPAYNSLSTNAWIFLPSALRLDVEGPSALGGPFWTNHLTATVAVNASDPGGICVHWGIRRRTSIPKYGSDSISWRGRAVSSEDAGSSSVVPAIYFQ